MTPSPIRIEGAENRVVSLDETRSDLSYTTDNYVHDGNGKRLIKLSNERGPGGTPLVTTRTLYIGNLYEEEIPNGQNARAYIVYYMLGEKLVGLRRANWQGQSNGQFRVVGDMLGSTTLIVDTSTSPGPQVVQRQYYNPYGEVAFSWGSSRTSIGYTGQRLDGESGLMYYGARYYDPVLSFFTQADPTVPDPGDLKDYNKYLYVRGNPLRYIDTSGYAAEDYYVFVNGCFQNSISGTCADPNWGGYLQLLERLFNEGNWGQGEEIWERQSFRSWSSTHVRFVGAPGATGEQGAANLNEELQRIQGSGFNIHLIGHSMGGAAVAKYIGSAMANEEGGLGAVNTFPLDPRISDITLIDPFTIPRGAVDSLGEWLGDRGVNLQIIDDPVDGIGVFPGGCPPNSLYCNGAGGGGTPTYSKNIYGRTRTTDLPPSDAGKRHAYTFTHVADQTREWLTVVWR